MVTVGLFIGGICGIIVGVFVGKLFGSVIWGLIAGLCVAGVVFDPFLKAAGDINRATQHERDGAILEELRKMNSKDE